jgi:hypothetical protein
MVFYKEIPVEADTKSEDAHVENERRRVARGC